MLVTSSKNCEAQSNDIAYYQSTPSASLKAKYPNKKKFKANTPNVNAHVLNNFIRSTESVSEIKVTNVNINAVRDFVRSYKNISDPKWFKTEGGYIANFLSKGIDTKVVYDQKGTWFYNLHAYTEDKLAFDIRHIVKSKYYDHDILIVYQYEFDKKTLYIIRIEDKQSNIRTLKVFDGEIEDITPRDKK